MSAEISTLVRHGTDPLRTLTVVRRAATAPLTSDAPAPTASACPRSPSLDDADPTLLEPLVDAVLRFLWALVGCYVWLVLLAKGPRPRMGSREVEAIVWPQADYPAVGLPALGLSSAGSTRRPVSPDFRQDSARP